ncbi:OLC1v1019886C2 [Oldenlandia corymbosa var. corymbosa]|uniref:acylaminoacyl-peptidase n=1 Tax=Oldenlandia corymbosa var. corymbosa TaxID=529605 RepID=A0AAV1EF64_OLDCO|nr:OLC1v1019886C2 [Oldenlandia corymbosa var. corymbosa]
MTKPLLHLTTIAAPFRIHWLHCHTPLLLPFPSSPSRFRSFFLCSKFFRPFTSRPFSQSGQRSFSSCLVMDSSGVNSFLKAPAGLDIASEEEYTVQSKLLQDFIEISSIDKSWTFASPSGNGSQCMFAISQPNLMANTKRRSILSSHIIKQSSDSVTFHWAPFPVELNGVSSIIPSPSGSKLLVVRNFENDSPTRFEVWGPSQVEKEFQIPRTIHGSVYCDGWFEGISWNHDETLIAYVAEEPVPSKPTFTRCGYKKSDSADKDVGSWKGQGEWEEDWGESYAGKRQSALFVININSGEVQAVKGIGKSLSVGQVVWAPVAENSDQYLVFVGWPSDTRKLGIKYCYNRPCGLYVVKAPFLKSEAVDSSYSGDNASDGVSVVALTESTGSAFFPRFSPGGKSLVFFSAKTAVESGAHWTTNSLHRIDWPADGKPNQLPKVVEVVPVVMCPEDGCFPGLYCTNILSKPWLSDGCTIIISSVWRSVEAILAINILSGNISRISPSNSNFVWNLLALDGDNIVAVSSSPVDIPQIQYGIRKTSGDATWSWLDISSPGPRCSEKVKSVLEARQFTIMQIPVKDITDKRTKGANNPYEAIFVSSKSQKNNPDPLIVVIHGGPHSVSQSSFSKSLAFLTSLGYSLLIVNYRGSLGFGEEALQSLPGNIGSQDVNDVLAAIDHVIAKGLADPSKIAVVGGSHGGFLTTHLIGQAPDKFAAAAARNPVCNLALMVGTSDIPDWCYAESFGSKGKSLYSDVASPEHLTVFYDKSPISHISKVKTPVIFLLGAKDLRVPVSNGIQYVRALKEKGNVVKLIVFPEDIHPIDRPQSDFESFLNIGVWFKKYCH